MNTKTLGQIAKHEYYTIDGTWDSAAAAVIAHHEASKQPQPKFKVGDRIRRVAEPKEWAPMGYETICSRRNYYKAADGGDYSIYPHQWEKVEWTLPAPPAGRYWHRQGFTEEMLPDGWRPLMMGELLQDGDQLQSINGWESARGLLGFIANACFMRTRRPLPPTHEITINLPPITLTSGKFSFASV